MLRKSLIAALLFLAAPVSQASITPIDTLPRQGDQTVDERTFTSYEWHDLAVGFSVSSAGFVTDIQTSLRADPSSLGPFYVGLASNTLIGNPSTPSYFTSPPGSLYEANVCSNVSVPQNGGRSSCDYSGFQSAPTFVLGANQALDITLNVYLPNAGIYWIYTRFKNDDVFATWTENVNEPSSLVARRAGANPDRAADRTFILAAAAGPAPGIRVTFNPVPEPETLALFVIGAIALLKRSHRTNSR